MHILSQVVLPSGFSMAAVISYRQGESINNGSDVDGTALFLDLWI